MCKLVLASAVEVLENVEETLEAVEPVTVHNLDDIYYVLSECSDKLGEISGRLDDLQEIGSQLLQLLQSSFLSSIAALLLILVGFEIMRLVRGWTKGDRYLGRNS